MGSQRVRQDGATNTSFQCRIAGAPQDLGRWRHPFKKAICTGPRAKAVVWWEPGPDLPAGLGVSCRGGVTVAPGGNTDISSRHIEEHLAKRAWRLPCWLLGARTWPRPAACGAWVLDASGQATKGQGHRPTCLGWNSGWKRISRHKAE